MAILKMFPDGEDKKHLAARQVLHDKQLAAEQAIRERNELQYPKTFSPAEFADKRASDIAEAEANDAAAIAASPNYVDHEV